MPQHHPSPPAPLASAVVTSLALSVCLGVGACSFEDAGPGADATDERAVPVEVGDVERRSLTYRRVVSGSLEAAAEFVVAPKVGGRIEQLEVDLGEAVARGQVVARLDDEEFVQDVQQAEANLAVAKASFAEAQSVLEIAKRSLTRLETLRADGVTSEAELDVGRAESVASRARLDVAQANVSRAESALRAARIRLGYTVVTADWNNDDEFRLVGERFVDEGGNVPPNGALFSVVQLDPIVAVVFVAERDYRLLALGQQAVLTTDAFPGRTFEGRLARISPVFRSASRQARVELELGNPDAALKPGMFVRATLELDHVDNAITVPYEALTERDDRTGVLVLEEATSRVRWQPVTTGIRDGDRIAVREQGVGGRVVTLGHELCDDGALVHVVAAKPVNRPSGPGADDELR
ncbi:MAG: efflux RND transporter periplasmic adaptor subunit [Planctomycetota bacterium]